MAELEIPLPPAEREKANAAYVWVKNCQVDLCEILGKKNSGKPGEWVEIVWAFRRLEAAVGMMAEAECAARACERAEGPQP